MSGVASDTTAPVTWNEVREAARWWSEALGLRFGFVMSPCWHDTQHGFHVSVHVESDTPVAGYTHEVAWNVWPNSRFASMPAMLLSMLYVATDLHEERMAAAAARKRSGAA